MFDMERGACYILQTQHDDVTDKVTANLTVFLFIYFFLLGCIFYADH